MQAFFLSLLWRILPLALPTIGNLIVELVQQTIPLIQAAAANQTLPDGSARHTFVTEQVVPMVKKSGVELVEVVQPELAGVIVKIAFDAAKALKK